MLRVINGEELANNREAWWVVVELKGLNGLCKVKKK